MEDDQSTAQFEDEDIFISYTHIDDQPFGPDQLKWVSHLETHLTNRVAQLAGRSVSVWRDPKLSGNDEFEGEITDKLANVGMLVSVISPRYVNSTWCLLELTEFVNAAEKSIGLRVGNKSRVFKVLKTPVDREIQPESLKGLLGYEFYLESDGEERAREFLLLPKDDEFRFFQALDDLAYDIAELLSSIGAATGLGARKPHDGSTVYLALTSSDVKDHRNNFKRELERRGHAVLPERDLLDASSGELIMAIENDLKRSEVSIHPLGAWYGARPEGEERSLPHIQLELALERSSQKMLVPMIWIPEGLKPAEEAQAKLILDLEERELGPKTQLLYQTVEDFKAHLLERLAYRASPETSAVGSRDDALSVYLITDERDREGDASAVVALETYLEGQGFEVISLPELDDEAAARGVHTQNLRDCDAVIVYYGRATQDWVWVKLIELLKAPGLGRTKPFLAKAVYLAGPESAHKQDFDTADAMVLRNGDRFSGNTLEPFVERVKAGRD